MRKIYLALFVAVLVLPMVLLARPQIVNALQSNVSESEYYMTSTPEDNAFGSLMVTLFGGIFVVTYISVLVATYVFKALALSKIAKELGYSNYWFAWLPILDFILLFQLGNQDPKFLLLLLIPAFGAIAVAVFAFMALMNITEKRGYDKALSLLAFIPVANLVLLGILAWKPKA